MIGFTNRQCTQNSEFATKPDHCSQELYQRQKNDLKDFFSVGGSRPEPNQEPPATVGSLANNAGSTPTPGFQNDSLLRFQHEQQCRLRQEMKSKDRAENENVLRNPENFRLVYASNILLHLLRRS